MWLHVVLCQVYWDILHSVLLLKITSCVYAFLVLDHTYYPGCLLLLSCPDWVLHIVLLSSLFDGMPDCIS